MDKEELQEKIRERAEEGKAEQREKAKFDIEFKTRKLQGEISADASRIKKELQGDVDEK